MDDVLGNYKGLDASSCKHVKSEEGNFLYLSKWKVKNKILYDISRGNI